MPAVVAQICVDPRLNHELLRVQIRQRLQRLQLTADSIYILSDVGGKPGASFRNTLELLKRRGEPVVLCAFLDHDECWAAEHGVGASTLQSSASLMASTLRDLQIRCPVLTGTIRTRHNHLVWSDEPQPRYEPFGFGVH